MSHAPGNPHFGLPEGRLKGIDLVPIFQHLQFLLREFDILGDILQPQTDGSHRLHEGTDMHRTTAKRRLPFLGSFPQNQKV
jgi:hypothetical protein